MTDYLLQLSNNARARRLVKSLGLPLPMPQKLARAKGPWEERPLQDRTVIVGSGPKPELHAVLAATLAAAGANPHLVGDEELSLPYVGTGEAYGRPPVLIPPGEVLEEARPHSLLFDATGLTSPADLRSVYDFFQPWIRALQKCGRVILLARPPELARTPEAAAARGALELFVRSLGKEIGPSGATAQVVYVTPGAEDRLPPPLRFLLSDRSAFITGQPLRVTTRARGENIRAYVRPLEGKVALVTGAARGIGRATARALAAEGARVVVLDRPADDGPASKVARDIGGELLLLDVTEEGAGATIAEFLTERCGHVDVVVHNAGITRDKMLRNMKARGWDQVIDVNLTAVTEITPALLAGPLKDGGRIICMSSTSGIGGNVGQTNYGAAKAGVASYVRALAKHTAERGITVNALAPGYIETRMTDKMPFAFREVGRRFNALSQGGKPADVAQVVTFLASPGAQGVTGEVLRVCGLLLIGA